jgi:adenylate kinase family enzyme
MAKLILEELARFRLAPHWLAPPFYAYIHAQNHKPEPGDSEIQHFFICRHEPPSRPAESESNVNYVSYKAAIGRLAAVVPGQTDLVTINMPHGLGTWQDTYTVLARDRFTVGRTADAWDAKDNKVLFPATTEEDIASLIAFLEQPEIPFGPPKPKRRKATDKFQLRDLVFVDAAQDEIWRLPLSTFLLISGAPGTGKTTVAIKRLAQKTKLQHLLPEETASRSEDQIRALFDGPNTWALFMPNDLLRNYLKEALAQEELPAADDHLLVWKDHKITIARDTLRYLKVGDRGFFRLTSDLLQCTASRRIAEWTHSFRDFFSIRVREEFTVEFERQSQEVHTELNALDENITTIEQQIDALRQQSASLAQLVSEEVDPIAKNEGQHQLEQQDRDRSERTSQLRPYLRAKELWIQLSQTAAAAKQSGSNLSAGRLNRLITDTQNQIESQLPRADQIPPAVRALRAAIEKIAGKYSPNSLVQRIPVVYHQFRLKENASFSFFKSSMMSQVNDMGMDSRELDTLIYTALSFIREAFDGLPLIKTSSDLPVQRLINEFRTVIAVDEAADFSAVELACMYLLSNPAFNAVTFAGDLMQRMTREGVSSWTELSLLLPPYKDYPLRLSYRQSARILRIAAELYKRFVIEPPPFDSAFADDPSDPAPLMFHAADTSATANWLVDRIIEIYRYNREQLPSIAIFVPTESNIAQLHELIAPKLLEHSIDTDPCYGGKVLGTQAKVRIFNVKYIKGLEFEAVFFTCIDEMAGNEPELLDKYLYVGLTRSRNFVAVTYKEHFPARIEFIKPLFDAGNWQSLLAQTEQ